jgi:hypothetical protein
VEGGSVAGQPRTDQQRRTDDGQWMAGGDSVCARG